MTVIKKPRILFTKASDKMWISVEKDEIGLPRWRIEKSDRFFQKNVRYSIFEKYRFIKGELESPRAVRLWLENYVEKLNSAGS